MGNEPHDLDPDVERELDAAWDHLDEGELDEAAQAIASARASAGDNPAVLELEAELALAQDDPETALDELPDEILAHLRNVPILVEDRPAEALVLEGLDPRTLGLFHGIAMPDQSVLGPGPSGGLIHLFQRNLEREALDAADLAEQIRITVAHETAHYFGADEEQLRHFGLN